MTQQTASQELASGLTRSILFCRLADAAIAQRLAACPPDNAHLLRKLQGNLRGVVETMNEIVRDAAHGQ